MDKNFNADLMLKKSFASMKHHKTYFGLLLLLFSILDWLLTLVAGMVPLPASSVGLLYIILMALLYVKMAVMIHRFFIIKDQKIQRFFHWSGNDLNYIGWLFAMYCIVVIVIYTCFNIIFPQLDQLDDSLSGFAVIPLFVILAIIFARLSLVLPAAAIERSLSLSAAWKLTRGKTGTLFFLMVFVPYFTSRLLRLLPDSNLWWMLLNTLFSTLIIMYEVALLSHCYQALMESRRNDIDTKESSQEETS